MVERAGMMGQAGDCELRYRCRHAPEFIRVNIDARRESRGLPPLWPGLCRRGGSARKAAGMPRRVRFLKAFLAAYGHRG